MEVMTKDQKLVAKVILLIIAGFFSWLYLYNSNFRIFKSGEVSYPGFDIKDFPEYKEASSYSSPVPYSCSKPIKVRRVLGTNVMGEPRYWYVAENGNEEREFCKVSGVF